MKLLNLSQFKKTKHDDHTAEMQHKDGHTIIIAIKKLPKIQQEQLKRLPLSEGGSVESGKQKVDHERGVHRDIEGDGKSMASVFFGHTKDPGETGAASKRLAKGEHTRVLSEMQSMKKPNLYAKGGMAHYDDGTADAPVSQNDAPAPDNSSVQGADHSITINVGQPSAGAAQAPSTPPAQAQSAPAPIPGTTPVANNPATQFGQQPVNAQAPVVPAPVSNLNATGTMNPAGVAKNTQTAAQAQGAIDAAKGQGMNTIEQQYDQARAQSAQIDQNNLNEIKGHVDDLNSYVQNNPINPNNYIENMNAGKKVGTALGLLLGGMGGKGNGNVAQDFLNNQINRDIDAQKARMDQQRTVYGAYHQLYGDSVATNNATKASMLDIYTHKANQLAAQMATPQAAQAAMQFGANAAIEKSKLLQEAAVNLGSLPGYAPTGPATSDTVHSTQSHPNAQPSIQQKTAPGPQGSYNESSYGMRTYPILAPGAVNAAQGLRHVGYLDQAKLQNQLTAADQVDKVINGPNRDGIGGIHSLMQDMYQDTGSGKIADLSAVENQLKSGVSHIPVVGGALESALNLAPSGEGYKDFQKRRSSMIEDLSTALQGLVAPTDIVKLVDTNLPQMGDTKEDVETSEQQIVNGIKKAMHTDELQKAGLLPARKH